MSYEYNSILLLNQFVAVGAKVTVAEIKSEEVNLQLCSHCTEIIERSKRPQFSTIELKIPKSSDRINRVLKFMDNYIQRGNTKLHMVVVRSFFFIAI